jgi:sarcosine oxidase subunit gamma
MPETYVAITRSAPRAMVSLRADLGVAKVKAAVRAAARVDMPAARRIVTSGTQAAAWMSPDELLLLAPDGEGAALAAALSTRLKGIHHLAADVSDLRIGWTLEGKAVREVLAKLTPADIARLPVGEVRRTRLAQVAAALWLVSETEARVLTFRSVSDYVGDLLVQSARKGSEVG